MTDPSGPAARWARPVARDVVEVDGPDAEAYLQGQCSQDVAALAVGASAEALLLSPQGKVDAWVRCTRTGPETFVLDTEAGWGSAVIARLERFKLRTRCTVRPLDWACLSVRTTTPGGPAGLTAPAGGTGGPVVAIEVDWPGWSGFDLLGPAPEGDGTLRAWVPEGSEAPEPAAWEAGRIAAGVPVLGAEVTEATIPAEVGLVDRTVSFAKGCYTGQELVARLDARGSKVARRLCGLVVAGDAVPPPGAEVRGEDGSAGGPVTSSAWSAVRGAPVALAVLHRRIEVPAPVAITWTDGDGTVREVAATAGTLPLG